VSIAGVFFTEETIRESLGEALNGISVTVFVAPGRGAGSARLLLRYVFWVGRSMWESW
jgi:hypothetical protein